VKAKNDSRRTRREPRQERGGEVRSESRVWCYMQKRHPECRVSPPPSQAECSAYIWCRAVQNPAGEVKRERGRNSEYMQREREKPKSARV